MSSETPRQSSFSAENLKPEYRAFISYRHMDNEEEGRQWASWLHQSLETYDVPSELVGEVNELGQPIPERVYPVFRDEEDLPADADLATAICSAVERSQCLVVLCSPRSAQSKYVAEEIAYFKQLGRENRILAVLIEGEPNASWDQGKHAAGIGPDRECFPLPLMHPVSLEGELDTTVHAEPIAAELMTRANAYKELGRQYQLKHNYLAHLLEQLGDDPDDALWQPAVQRAGREMSMEHMEWLTTQKHREIEPAHGG